MKNKPSSMLKKVWAMKKAVQDETEGMTAKEYFRHIREHMPKLDLPVAKRPRRRTSRPRNRRPT